MTCVSSSFSRVITRPRSRSGPSPSTAWSISGPLTGASPCSRRQIRRGIRAVQAGEDPTAVLTPDDTGRVPTFCNDTVVYAPAAPSGEEDVKMMRETGRGLAEEYVAARSGANGK